MISPLDFPRIPSPVPCPLSPAFLFCGFVILSAPLCHSERSEESPTTHSYTHLNRRCTQINTGETRIGFCRYPVYRLLSTAFVFPVLINQLYRPGRTALDCPCPPLFTSARFYRQSFEKHGDKVLDRCDHVCYNYASRDKFSYQTMGSPRPMGREQTSQRTPPERGRSITLQ